MTECDILFNTKFVFSTDTPTPSGKMDLESIALHELGHWLSLTDLYGDLDREKVMYGYASYGGMKRDITEYDREGIRWIYGTSAPLLGPLKPRCPSPLRAISIRHIQPTPGALWKEPPLMWFT